MAVVPLPGWALPGDHIMFMADPFPERALSKRPGSVSVAPLRLCQTLGKPLDDSL